MRKAMALFGLMIILCCQAFPKAIIKFKQTEIDFGLVEGGKIVEVQFEFENSGDSVLIIKEINTSCGCVQGKMNKMEYQPGEKGIIPIQYFHPHGRNGMVSQSITVSTNDEDNVYVTLKISGMVQLKDYAKIEIVDNKLNFTQIEYMQKYEKSVTIRNTGTIDLIIMDVSHPPEISTEFSNNVVSPGQEIDLKIILKPMQKGKYLTFLKIKTNAQNEFQSIVRLEAEIVGNIKKN